MRFWMFEAFRMIAMAIGVVFCALVIVTILERWETWRKK